MGFDDFFAEQVPQESLAAPCRITEIHRARLTALSPHGQHILTTKHGQETGALAVGDWVLADPGGEIETLLKRKTLLHRRAAGTDARQQLIAANCDTLFITSSCNADFNPARIERFLVLAYESNCQPVILLTKADQTTSPADWLEKAKKLDPRVACLAINAKDPQDLARVAHFCRNGQTGALVGSSGVGKTTLTNGLCARQDPTGAIREEDGRGRHVTTSRALRATTNGGWIIDTPGMRALRLEDVGSGLSTLFDDIAELALTCRFSNCAHASEPGCAVRSAIEAGDLDAERVQRWQKLRTEDTRNTATLEQSRRRREGKNPRYR